MRNSQQPAGGNFSMGRGRQPQVASFNDDPFANVGHPVDMSDDDLLF